MAPMRPVNLALDEDTLARLAQLERVTGHSRSQVVRDAVADYFAREGERLTKAALAELSRPVSGAPPGRQKRSAAAVGPRKRRQK